MISQRIRSANTSARLRKPTGLALIAVALACASETPSFPPVPLSIDVVSLARDHIGTDSVDVRFDTIRAGDQHKFAFALQRAGQIELPPLSLEAGWQLHFDYALLPREDSSREPTTLRVRARPSGTASQTAPEAFDLFQVSETPPASAETGKWNAVAVEIPVALGGDVILSFEMVGPSRNHPTSATGVWGDVVLLPPLATIPKGRRNVVLVSLDTLRAKQLAIYGYEAETTPFLTSLADRLTVYESAYTPSTWTLPAHASVFTGLYPSHHGATSSDAKLGGRPLAPEFTTLAEVLEAAGYLTLGIAAGPMLKRDFGVNQGFAYYSDSWNPGKRRANTVNALALDWLDRANGRPFFLFVNYFDPHTPVDPPGYGDADHAIFAKHGIDVTGFNWRFLRENGMKGLPADAAEAMLARYDAEIRYLDQALREFFDALETRGLLDNTLICILADHGESYGESDLWGHGGTFLNSQAHVPLLYGSLGPPKSGRRERRPLSTAEIPGMLLRDLGIESPDFDREARPIYGERFLPVGSNRLFIDDDERYLVRLRIGPDGLTRYESASRVGEDGAESPLSKEAADALRERYLEYLAAEQLAPEDRTAYRIEDRDKYRDEREAPLNQHQEQLRQQLEALGYVGEE